MTAWTDDTEFTSVNMARFCRAGGATQNTYLISCLFSDDNTIDTTHNIGFTAITLIDTNTYRLWHTGAGLAWSIPLVTAATANNSYTLKVIAQGEMYVDVYFVPTGGGTQSAYCTIFGVAS